MIEILPDLWICKNKHLKKIDDNVYLINLPHTDCIRTLPSVIALELTTTATHDKTNRKEPTIRTGN